MIFPPTLLRVRMPREGRRAFRLWLPLFLIWPVAAALGLAFWAVAVAVRLLSGRWRRMKGLLLGPAVVFALFCRLRGLRIEAEDERGVARIQFL